MAGYGMGIVVAPIIGPTLGGWITDNYSWRWIFYINVPVGILAVLMAQSFNEDPPYIKAQRPGRIDYVGFGLMALGLATLIVLDKGQEDDWFSSAFITRTLIIAVVALVAFVVWELRAKEPIVNLRVLTNRNFAVGTALIFAMGVVLYGTSALLPLFLQTLLGYPAEQSGLAVSIRSIAWPQILSGFAMGFVFVPLTVIATGTLRIEQLGNATGIFNLMRNVGGGFGIAAVTTMLARGAQTHQAMMVGHLTPYDPAFQQRVAELMGAIGSTSAQRMERSIRHLLDRPACWPTSITFTSSRSCAFCVLRRRFSSRRSEVGEHP